MKNTTDKVDGGTHKFQNIGGSDCSFDSINPGFFEQPNLFSDGIKAIPNFGTKDLMDLLNCSRSKLDSFRHRNGLPEGSLERNGGRSRTVYSLSEYREWVRCIRQSELRPDGSLASPAVISFVGTRSGSGKTFAAATLAQGLCQRGHRILIIDLDGQASLSQFFGKANVFDEDTYLGVVNSSSPSFDGLIQNTQWDGIDIIPATAAIFDIERLNRIQLSIFARIDTPVVSRFGDCLHEILIREVGGYDFVIIDTHSGVDALAMASVLESSALIYPIGMNFADIKSADWYLKFIRGTWLEQKISERRPEYYFIGFLPNKVSVPGIEAFGEAFGESVIPVEIPFLESDGIGFLKTCYGIDRRTIWEERFFEACEGFVTLVEAHYLRRWKLQWAASTGSGDGW